jgi:mRNA interferase MazF
MNPPAGPRIGEVYWADLNPTIGSEQRGDRPVIVFQNPVVGRFTSTVLVVPTTTSMRRLGLPGTCGLPAGAGAMPKESVALAYQLRAIDRQRLRGRIGRLGDEHLPAVRDAVLSALGIAIE